MQLIELEPIEIELFAGVNGDGILRPAQLGCQLEQLDLDGFKFNQLHLVSFAAVEMSLTRQVVEFLAAIFQAPPVLMQSLTFFKGSQQPIHLDYPYVRVQTKSSIDLTRTMTSSRLTARLAERALAATPRPWLEGAAHAT